MSQILDGSHFGKSHEALQSGKLSTAFVGVGVGGGGGMGIY